MRFKEPDIVNVDLIIHGYDCSYQEITDYIGLEPSETASKGEHYTLPTGSEIPRKYNTNYWTIKSVGDTKKPLLQDRFDVKLDNLIKLTSGHADPISELSKKYYVELSIYGYHQTGGSTGLHIDAKRLQKINELGAGVDIDFYVFEPET